MECVYLEEAKYLSGFRVFLRFNDGRAGEIDLEDVVYKHAAAISLRDTAVFARFHLDSWPTLAWDCGFDVAPESLYEKCEQATAADADKPRR